MNIRQEPKESLRSFISRFQKKIIDVEDLEPKIARAALLNAPHKGVFKHKLGMNKHNILAGVFSFLIDTLGTKSVMMNELLSSSKQRVPTTIARGVAEEGTLHSREEVKVVGMTDDLVIDLGEIRMTTKVVKASIGRKNLGESSR